jgi:hypothetical protein
MTTEKHDPWALLREARDVIDYRDCDCGNEACERLGVFVRRIDAAIKAHKEAAQDETDDVDPFSASYQRAFVNGCDVQIERENNGTWRWHVRKSRTEAHALLDGMREIARGPAATESQAKMLALEVARSAR